MVERDQYTTAVSDGDQLNQGFFRGIGVNNTPLTTYTGTGFDSSASVSNGTGSETDTQNHEITIPASDLVKLETGVLVINAGVSAVTFAEYNAGSEATSTATIKIESKEVGGSYADDLPTTTLSFSRKAGSLENYTGTNRCFFSSPILHTLTSGELSNGITINIETTSGYTTSGGNMTASASVTNLGTIILGY